VVLETLTLPCERSAHAQTEPIALSAAHTKRKRSLGRYVWFGVGNADVQPGRANNETPTIHSVIARMRPDGSGLVQITTDAAEEQFADWAP
jgi:hypothetical protein